MSKPFEDGKFVAIVHHLCPCCAKQDAGDIMLHRGGRDISEMHEKNVGWELCDECRENMTRGVMVVVVDRDKMPEGSTDIKDWYRTGNIFGMSEAWVNRALEGEALVQALQRRMMLMDYKDAIAIGLPVKYTP